MFKMTILSMRKGQHEKLHPFETGQEVELTVSGQVYLVFDPTSDSQHECPYLYTFINYKL